MNTHHERQSAPTGATEPENQEQADRPSVEPETPEPFSRGFAAMADELLRDKWALAILINRSTRQDLRQLLVELILWQELGRPDLEELRARFSDDETQERVQELQASPWSEILSLVGLTLCEDGSVIVSGERQSALTGATELENQEGADRPLGDAACSVTP